MPMGYCIATLSLYKCGRGRGREKEGEGVWVEEFKGVERGVSDHKER